MKLKAIPQNTVVHTPTEEEAKELLAILHENGYEWYCSAKEEGWENFGDETCYRINSHDNVYHTCDRKWYETTCKYCRLPILTLAEFKERYVDFDDTFTNDCKSHVKVEEKPQPKFKVGDKVRIIQDGTVNPDYVGIVDEIAEVGFVIKLKNTDSNWGSEALEPYTEPETKPTVKETKESEETFASDLKPTEDMETNELNLCDLLKGHEGEWFFNTSFGDVRLEELDATRGQIEINNDDCGSWWLTADGRFTENAPQSLFPSRALYEQYPLDAAEAWQVWQSEQKKYTLVIAWKCPDREHSDSIKHINFRTSEDRDKCIEEIKAIIEKYSKK